ncbi:hypothetical protein HAX54_031059 [Datura stramonium]|uniref:Cytochrome P450 n=1 Tax=Datura stramonium TaxID=4076 RepID=A0ABS8VBP6_DATST|nr:hypothetical protein [Datura stramonium]
MLLLCSSYTCNYNFPGHHFLDKESYRTMACISPSRLTNVYWREMRKIRTIHLFRPKKVQSSRPIREYENIFIAGTDTSVVALVCTITTLIKEEKSVMRKLQEGIRELVEYKGRADEDDIQNLPYLKAIIKETVRLYLPAPLLVPRETIKKCTIDGYDIKPNTLVFVNVWAIGRDPECWESPDKFIPERFVDVTNNDIVDYNSGKFEMISFGGGRRGCPGFH